MLLSPQSPLPKDSGERYKMKLDEIIKELEDFKKYHRIGGSAYPQIVPDSFEIKIENSQIWLFYDVDNGRNIQREGSRII